MKEQEREKQVMCEKCGRGYSAENMGDYENPKWVMPVHRIKKGNGASKVIICKNSGKPI